MHVTKWHQTRIILVPESGDEVGYKCLLKHKFLWVHLQIMSSITVSEMTQTFLDIMYVKRCKPVLLI